MSESPGPVPPPPDAASSQPTAVPDAPGALSVGLLAPPVPTKAGPRFFDRPGVPPATTSDAFVWLLLALAGFAAGQVVASIFTVVAAVLAGQPASAVSRLGLEASPPEWFVVASLVGIWAGFGLAPWLASRARGTRRFCSDLGLRFRWIDLLGLVVGVAGQFCVSLLYDLIGDLSAPIRQDIKRNFNAPSTHLTGSSHGWGFALIALLTIVGAPFFEELFFRGLLFKSLLRLFSPADPHPGLARALAVAGAVVLDGILFGLAHGELLQLYGLALFGMVLALVSYRTGRLGMNMVAHAAFNATAVLVILYPSALVLR